MNKLFSQKAIQWKEGNVWAKVEGVGDVPKSLPNLYVEHICAYKQLQGKVAGVE